jgi:hypothetical protein
MGMTVLSLCSIYNGYLKRVDVEGGPNEVVDKQCSHTNTAALFSVIISHQQSSYANSVMSERDDITIHGTCTNSSGSF